MEIVNLADSTSTKATPPIYISDAVEADLPILAGINRRAHHPQAFMQFQFKDYANPKSPYLYFLMLLTQKFHLGFLKQYRLPNTVSL